MSTFCMEVAALHFITAVANLLPFGPMDGHRMFAAWRALQATQTAHARPVWS